MKIFMILIYLVLSNAFLSAKESAITFPEVSIGKSQQRFLHSNIVNQEYKLWISPPQGYDLSTKSYPVIYLLDAQWDFTLMISLYGQLRADGDIPEALLVGVTWGGENPNVDALRYRDFLPITIDPNNGVSGADSFLDFFEKELFPFIDSEYRVNEERILIGSSFAGWFTLYTMFQRPDLFYGFLVTAPTIGIQDGKILSLTKEFPERVNDDNTRMYMAIGDRDGNLDGFNRAIEFLHNKKFAGLTYKTELFENLSHSSIKGNGNTRGLQYLFKRQEVSLSNEQLKKLIGSYILVDSDEQAIVSIKKNQIVISVVDKYNIQLKPATATKFFINNYGLEVIFDPNSQPVTMEFHFTGGSQLFEREVNPSKNTYD